MNSPTTYRVEWADVARRDLDEIAVFISKDSLTAALRLADLIEERAAALVSMPRRGRVPPELERFRLEIYRELLITPYRLIYRVYEDTAVVLDVFDVVSSWQDSDNSEAVDPARTARGTGRRDLVVGTRCSTTASATATARRSSRCSTRARSSIRT